MRGSISRARAVLLRHESSFERITKYSADVLLFACSRQSSLSGSLASGSRRSGRRGGSGTRRGSSLGKMEEEG